MKLVANADVAPAQERGLIAPWWHTGIVLVVLAAVTLAAIRAHGTSTSGQDRHGGIPLYVSVIVFEWALFYLAYAGTRKRIALRELIGLRWAGGAALFRSVLITIVFWLVWEGSGRVMHRLLGASDLRNVTSMLPRTALEIFVWILVSVSAGICEEFVYRGYLQRQFAAMTRSGVAALVLQAIVFGVSHGYQGWKQVVIISVLGALFGLLAQWRRSLVPGMAAHAWADIYSGWLHPGPLTRGTGPPLCRKPLAASGVGPRILLLRAAAGSFTIRTALRLQDKIALITGAGSGIGRACAIAFGREGAQVALVGRRKTRLEEVAREIGGGKALVAPADIGNKQHIERVVRSTAEHFGGLTVLVNNAGVLIPGTAESHTDQEWEATFNVNVRAVWLLSRAALPHMRRAGGGSIVNISSVLGLVGARNRVAYSASKGAVTLLTKSMALDHASENVRVNCICPGIVDTELVADFVRRAPDPKAALQERISRHPIGRFGKPEEIAAMAVYLASDESSWVTGAAFPIDGGFTAG